MIDNTTKHENPIADRDVAMIADELATSSDCGALLLPTTGIQLATAKM